MRRVPVIIMATAPFIAFRPCGAERTEIWKKALLSSNASDDAIPVPGDRQAEVIWSAN
jgi:hypothetical protein